MNALEFADMIERYNAGVMSQKIYEDYKDAADELRRLAAIEAELVALKKSLAAAPAAPSELDMDEYRAMVAAMELIDPATLTGLTTAQRCALGRFAKPVGWHAGDTQPVVWVAADTLKSPHPVCVSSLAYMSQIDKDRGREYVPVYAAPVATQAEATAGDARDAYEMADAMLTPTRWLTPC